MAEANKSTVRVEKTTFVDETRVTLSLTSEEADALAGLLGHVSGSPDSSPRKHRNAIASALRAVGYRYDNSKAYPLISGELRCKDFTEVPQALKVGDTIRILERNHNGARVSVNDLLKVTSVGSHSFRTDRAGGGEWHFMLVAEDSGWERVPQTLKVGDRIRLLRNRSGAGYGQYRGDVVTVEKVDGGYQFVAGGAPFMFSTEGATWERA